MDKKQTIEQILSNLTQIERKIYEFKNLLSNNEDMIDDLKITILGHLVCRIDDLNEENCNIITCCNGNRTTDGHVGEKTEE